MAKVKNELEAILYVHIFPDQLRQFTTSHHTHQHRKGRQMALITANPQSQSIIFTMN